MHCPQVTNPTANIIPNTLCEIPNILTDDEASNLAKSIDNQYYRQWSPEGYDRRNRTQRYSYLDDKKEEGKDSNNDDGKESMEEVFGWLIDRFIAAHTPANSKNTTDISLHRPYEVVVIEHTPSSFQSTVNVFEERSFCSCKLQHQPCNCYVAQLTLMNNALQSIEKPMKRELECWELAEPTNQHETQIVMKQNSIIIKSGDSLWNWRGRISNVQTNDEIDLLCQRINDNHYIDPKKKTKGKPWTGNTPKLKTYNHKRCIILTFRGIRQQSRNAPPTPVTIPREVKPVLPLKKLLTIIVTTSPIRSNPSTEMLEETFNTFPLAGEEFAFECPKIIICDGCRVFEEESNGDDYKEEKKDDRAAETTTTANTTSTHSQRKISRKHSNDKQALRNGIATVDQAKKYTEFKLKLRKLCEDATGPSQSTNAFRNTQVVELEERHGYGFALKHALHHCVKTPNVCVIQHDRTFMRQTPIKEVVAAMENDPEQKIKYVGMSMRSNLMYYDIFSGKYGRRAVDEFRKMIRFPEELYIGENIYGLNGKSEMTLLPKQKDKREHVLQSMKDAYRGSHQYITYDEQSKEAIRQNVDGFHQLTLTPLLFWYDNTHVVSTAHYRDFVFDPKNKMVARGGFVEDKLSPCLVRSCERLGLTEGHSKFGCYMLDDHSGTVFTGHLDGGSFMTASLHMNK